MTSKEGNIEFIVMYGWKLSKEMGQKYITELKEIEDNDYHKDFNVELSTCPRGGDENHPVFLGIKVDNLENGNYASITRSQATKKVEEFDKEIRSIVNKVIDPYIGMPKYHVIPNQ